MLLPLLGVIIWVVKVQGTLNRFWEKGRDRLDCTLRSHTRAPAVEIARIKP
jgi:hypothetical protein